MECPVGPANRRERELQARFVCFSGVLLRAIKVVAILLRVYQAAKRVSRDWRCSDLLSLEWIYGYLTCARGRGFREFQWGESSQVTFALRYKIADCGAE